MRFVARFLALLFITICGIDSLVQQAVAAVSPEHVLSQSTTTQEADETTQTENAPLAEAPLSADDDEQKDDGSDAVMCSRNQNPILFDRGSVLTASNEPTSVSPRAQLRPPKATLI